MAISNFTLIGLALVGLVALANGGIINDIRDAVDAIACPMKYTEDYDRCSAAVNPLYQVKNIVLKFYVVESLDDKTMSSK